MMNEINSSNQESKQLKKLKNQLIQNEVELENARAQLKTLSLQNSDLQQQINLLSNENQILKKQNSEISKCGSFEHAASKTISQIEQLVQEQSSEISCLTSQRDHLLSIVQKADHIFSSYKNLFNHYSQEIESLKEDINNMKQLHQEELESIFTECLEQVPESIEINEDEFSALSPDEKIIYIVTTLSDNYSSSQENLQQSFSTPKSSKINVSRSPMSVSSSTSMHEEIPATQKTAREALLVGHLENAIRCIRQLLTGNEDYGQYSEPDQQTRDIILAQCTRISTFAIENKISDKEYRVPNIFTKGNIDDQLASLYAFVDSKSRGKAPFQDLFGLFAGVLQINEYIMNSFNLFKEQIQTYQQNDVKALQLQLKVEELKSKMVSNFSPFTSSSLDIDANLSIIIDQFNKMKGSIHLSDEEVGQFPEKMNEEQNNELSQKNEQIKALQDRITILQNHFDNLKATKEANEERMKKQLDDATKCLEMSKRDRKALEIYQKKAGKISLLKKIIETLSHDKDNLLDITRKLKDDLVASQSEIQVSNTKIQSLSNSLQETKENEEKLREKVKSYRAKISELEKINRESLSELQKHSDELDKTYSTQLEKRHNEVNSLSVQLKVLNDQIVNNSKSRHDQIELIAQLKASEKTLRMKVESLEKTIKVNEQTAEKRLETQKTLYQAMSEQTSQPLINLIQTATSKVKTLINNIGMNENSNDTILEMLDKIADLPIHLKNSFDEIEQLKNEQKESKSVIETQDNLIRQMKEHAESFEKISKRAEEADIWDNWGYSLYRAVTDYGINHVSEEEEDESDQITKENLRFALQEAIMASIQHKNLLSRLNMLRDEKKALLAAQDGKIRMIPNNPYKKVAPTSIRPILLVFLCTKRLAGTTK